ncbi:MAG: hypothetical protein H0V01_07835 [Bacteroidetes bacterium]|nr:hypothetical protein [Bacteroidota bacterium]HET6244389.1 hypothetical protein [Bacteroidia bacterium]
MKNIFFVVFIVFLFSCCDFLEIAPKVDQKHFDIPGFFIEELKRLNETENPIIKEISKDEEREDKIIKTPDWQKELAAFIDVDINKPALINSFTVDTIVVSGDSYEIYYNSIEESSTIRNISLLYENNSCTFVKIEKNNTNALFSSKQYMQYTKKSGYSILGELSIRFIYKTNYHVNAKFL